jgi:hypothetical protein
MLSSYQWMNCDSGQIIPGEVNQSFTPTVDGWFAVIVSDSGCIDTSYCYQIVITNIFENDKEQFFAIIPNPTCGKVMISSKIPMDKIEVYNAIGELIYNCNDAKLEKEIDITGQPDGIYFLNVYSDRERQSEILIKD